MKLVLRALVLTLAIAAPAARALTGNELHELMQSTDPIKITGAALYIYGVSDGLAYMQYADMEAAKRAPMNVCTPKNASSQQAYDIVKDYLVRNPSWRHYDAGPVVVAALHGAWPCK